MSNKKTKIPTVDQFLYCLVGRGESINDILATYAALGFHYDGVDRSGYSLRALKRFISEIDREAEAVIGSTGGATLVDDDGSDDVLIRYGDQEYRFRAATLKDRIKTPDTDLGPWLREMIGVLGDPRLLDLPYPLTAKITEAASMVAGFL